MGSWGLEKHAHWRDTADVAGLSEKVQQKKDDSAEEQMREQRAGEQMQDKTEAVRLRGPHVWKAATGGRLDVAVPSRRQRSVVIRAVTATLQASRVLRWRVTIGDCCANGTALRKGATGWPWLSTASCGSRLPLA
jgi:hypothetical protein